MEYIRAGALNWSSHRAYHHFSHLKLRYKFLTFSQDLSTLKHASIGPLYVLNILRDFILFFQNPVFNPLKASL